MSNNAWHEVAKVDNIEARWDGFALYDVNDEQICDIPEPLTTETGDGVLVEIGDEILAVYLNDHVVFVMNITKSTVLKY